MGVTVGADFEFEVYDGIAETIICAKYFIMNSRGKIGLDGCSSIGEMRPDYSKNVNLFFRNILSTFSDVSKYINTDIYEIRFDSVKHPTGFHIHFGFDYTPYERKEFCVDLADFLTAVFYKTVFKYNSPIRKNSSYSKPNNYRIKPHGIEYRETPSIILNEPEYLRVFVKVLQKIVELFISQDINVSSEDVDTTSYTKYIIIKDKRGIPSVKLNKNFYENVCNLNKYEIEILDKFLEGDFGTLSGIVSPLFKTYFSDEENISFKGTWDPLKTYVIYNLFRIFGEKDCKINKCKKIVFSKTKSKPKLAKSNSDKSFYLYMNLDFVNSQIGDWNKDKEHWEFLLEKISDITPMENNKDLIEDYLSSFY